MTQLSRRHFLQAAGAALTTAGLSRWQRDRYGKVLAQSTPRKLALLVGINDYVDAPLAGCVNDAILQRQLLIHRFGFNPKDILMLLNGDATREGLLMAFEEHLIKQAKPGDVVVYHFSGHGSQVLDPQPIAPDFTDAAGNGLNGTFVPIDATLPETYPAEGGAVKDIMGHTFFLLMSAIQTEQFTAVLDSCFSGSATRSSTGLVHRARSGGKSIEISPLEMDYQDQWRSRLGWSPEEFVQRYQQGIANGVILASTQRDQYAVDEQLNGFTAGAFTFRLTQQLWQTNTTPTAVIDHINRVIPEDYEQNPQVEAEPGSEYAQNPMFFVDNPGAVADALVVERPQDKAVLLLVGIAPGRIRRGQVFQVLGQRGEVAIAFRDGLAAVGAVSGRVQVGDRLKLIP